MSSRPILAGLLAIAAMPVHAEPAGRRIPASGFEEKAVAILNAGGTEDAMQARLNRLGADQSLTVDQRLAIDALNALVRSRGKPKGLSLADAEAFAARKPDSLASALMLAEAALANDEPQRSADTLIAAAARGSSLVQLVSPTTVSRLTDELDKLSDSKRTAGLAKALLYSGWSRGSAGLRSYLALAAMRDEIASSQIERARRLLPAVTSPASLHLILIDNRLAPLRGDVEHVAGPKLDRAWREYLAKTRDEWLSRGDVLSALAYVEALKSANQYDALNAAFLARFMRGYNCPSDLVARSIAADLAETLAKTGRWSKAEDVMRRSGGVSTAVYGTMLLERGEFGRAAALFDRSLRAAGPAEDTDDERALAWLRAAGACAAFRSGNGAAALPSDLTLLDVSARLFVLLCVNRDAEAQAALIAALDDEEERADALRWVQPFADPAALSGFRREMNERIRALQRDSAIAAAVARYGMILDWPLTVAAPQAAELAAAQPRTPWQCGDEASWEALPSVPDSMQMPDGDP